MRRVLRQVHIKHEIIIFKITWIKVIQDILQEEHEIQLISWYFIYPTVIKSLFPRFVTFVLYTYPTSSAASSLEGQEQAYLRPSTQTTIITPLVISHNNSAGWNKDWLKYFSAWCLWNTTKIFLFINILRSPSWKHFTPNLLCSPRIQKQLCEEMMLNPLILALIS